MIHQVYRGVPTTADVEFHNPDGTPFVSVVPVTYTVSDFNRNLIVTGVATQDLDNPARWFATFTVPNTAPISELGEKYRVAWVATGQGMQKTLADYFTVKLETDPIALEMGRLVLSGAPIQDTLILDDKPEDMMDIRVIDSEGHEYFVDQVDNLPTREVNDLYHFDYKSCDPLPSGVTSSITPFFTEWRYVTKQGPGFEVHPIFLITPRMYHFIDALRRSIDRANNQDINPSLQWSDIDLAHFVLMGLQRININNPTITSWLPDTIPPQFYEFLNKAAAIEALRAQYLAEGMAAFDFSGQAVQLQVDRTQYIQTVIDQLDRRLESDLQRAKRLWVRRSGPGVLGITFGTHTNYPVHINMRDQFSLMRLRFLRAF